MIRKLLMLLILLAAFKFGILSTANASGNNDCLLPPVQESWPRTYSGADGTIYLNCHYPAQLHLSPAIDSTQKKHLAEQLMTVPAPLYLVEGVNTICNSNHDKRSAAPSCFEIWGDATPPQTACLLTDAQKFCSEGNCFFGPGLKLSLEASDAVAGVQKTLISLNGAPFIAWEQYLADFEPDQRFCVYYFSEDNVGNCENIDSVKFFTDNSPPTTVLSISGVHHASVLAAEGILTLKSLDTRSGVRNIWFRPGNEEMRPYHGSIPFQKLPNGTFSIGFYAEDNVGNKEPVHTQTLVYDPVPPVTTLSFEGDFHEEKGVVFISAKSRIRLDASDSLSEVDSISYRIDTSHPLLYTAPFPLPPYSKLYGVEVLAIDAVRNRSEPAIHHIYVDITAPESHHNIDRQFFYSSDTCILSAGTRISLVSNDHESGLNHLWYRLNDGEDLLYNNPLVFDTDGVSILTYFATDNVKNREEQHALLLRVDSGMKPVGEVTPGEHLKKWILSNNYGLIGAAGLPFYLRVAASKADDAVWFLVGAADEKESLYFSGNHDGGLHIDLAKVSRLYPFSIDAAAPLTSIALSGAESYVSGSKRYFGGGLTVSFNARDTLETIRSGVEEINYSINGSPFGNYHTPLSIFSREQEYTLRWYSVDSVGNSETVGSTVFIVDITPPRTEIGCGNAFLGRELSDKSTITLQSSDNLAGVHSIRYFFDNGPERNCTGTITAKDFSQLNEGEHSIHYYAKDNVGNVEKQRSHTISIDRTPSMPRYIFIGQHSECNETHYIAIDSRIQVLASEVVSGVETLWYRVGASAWEPCQAPFKVPVFDEHVNVSCESRDAVGNIGKGKTLAVFVDVKPPHTTAEISGKTFNDGVHTWINPKSSIILQATDDASGVAIIQFQDNGRPFKKYSRPFSPVIHGLHTIISFANDNVNNIGKQCTLDVWLDTKSPDLQILSGSRPLQNGAKISPQDLIYFRVADDGCGVQNVRYRINGSDERLYRQPISSFRPGSSVDLEVTAVDWVDNMASKQLRFTVKENGDE